MEHVQIRSVGCTVAKLDAERRLVFGFGIVCKIDGEDYYDLQDEHVPESVMLDSALDFIQNSAVAKEQHDPDADGGMYVFAFPLTTELAKALQITTKKTGLLLGLRATVPVFKRFEAGELTGFSIHGKGRVTLEEIEVAA